MKSSDEVPRGLISAPGSLGSGSPLAGLGIQLSQLVSDYLELAGDDVDEALRLLELDGPDGSDQIDERLYDATVAKLGKVQDLRPGRPARVSEQKLLRAVAAGGSTSEDEIAEAEEAIAKAKADQLEAIDEMKRKRGEPS